MFDFLSYERVSRKLISRKSVFIRGFQVHGFDKSLARMCLFSFG